MNTVVSPLKPQMQGQQVADLQDALAFLLDKALVLKNDDNTRKQLAAGVHSERDHQLYSDYTTKVVARFQTENRLQATGVVDDKTAAAINALLPQQPPEFQYLVRGQVLYRGGRGIPGLGVQAFHRELRGEIQLGATKTDAAGNFEIYYNPQPPGAAAPSADRPPDLFLRVLDAACKVVAESPTRYPAQRVEKFRLLVEGGPSKTWSEFEQLSDEMRGFLGGVKVEDLTEDKAHQDVTVLAGKTAQEPARVAAFIAAHKMAAAVKGDPSVFYALVREGLPTNLPDLLAVPAGTRSRALAKAIREGVAPGSLVGQVRKIRTQFEQHAIDFGAVDQVTEGRARLGSVLKTTVGDPNRIRALVDKIITQKGPTPKLWESAAADPQLKDVVPAAQRSLQLAALTGRHLPMMNAILGRFQNGQVKSISDLATLTEKDWLDLIDSLPEADRVPPSIPGKDVAEKSKVYAATLARIVSDTMPTQALAFKVQADPSQPADVKTFWKNVTSRAAGFALGHGRVGPYLEKNPALLAGVGDKAALVRNVEETQRLFSLTASYDEQKALRSLGLTSALAVSRLGQSAFIQKVGGTPVTAQQAVIIYERAARISAAALDLATTYSPVFNKLSPRVVPAPDVAQVPDLETLFGTFDLCACDQCRSVHGPAAYFADLLAFLDDRPAKAAGVSARDVLLRRRPDLGETELTCANTNTVLPYTDLVNEILEARLAPFQPFALPAASEAELNANTISAAVRAAFSAKGIRLAEDVRAVVGSASERWSITDGSTLYPVVKTGGAIQATGAWPQTGASADSVAAVPEHINPAAYDILRGAVYPWALPLDLPTEETRVFLEHLHTPRHELMAQLLPGGPGAALDDAATAAEYLGLSDVERQYITNTVGAPNPARKQWEFWGLAENGNTVNVYDPAARAFADKALGWVDAVSQVRQTLYRSGLEYDDLVSVLECEFVNPDRKARIVSVDPDAPATCDVAKLKIDGLTDAMADKLTRFVRLWRKLGWTVAELDLALTSLCGGQLDNAAILKLSHLKRLSGDWGLSVEELLPLWVAIPAAGTDSLYQRLFLNPTVLTPVDPAFTLGAGNELAIVAADAADAKISKHTPAVLAALRVSAADLQALQAAGVASDDNLTLANLSRLYRHGLLARSLELTIPDLLLLISMTGVNPFDPAATAETLRLAGLKSDLGQSGLAIADLGYLLFHLSPDTAAIAPPLGATTEMIAEIRRQLKVIRDATAPRPDPSGDQLRRELAALKWPANMIDDAIAALGGAKQYTAALDPAPPGFAVPADFASRLSYDATAKTLTLTGSLTAAGRDTLKAAFAPANYKAAIDDLFAQPRSFAVTRFRAYDWPAVSAPLAALPAGIVFPPALRPRVSFDPSAQLLTFDGTMSDADKNALDALSADAAWRAATAALLANANAFAPAADNQFLTAASAGAVFEQSLPADRFASVLAMVLALRRAQDSSRLVIRLVADTVGMTYKLAERLLTRDLPHPVNAGQTSINVFLEDPFASSNPDVEPSETAFPAAFEIALRLMKIAALVAGMGLSDRVTDWLGTFAAGVPSRKAPWGGGAVQAKWLSLAELPARTQAVDAARFAAWARLLNLGRVGNGLQGGEATAGAIFAEARKPGADAASVAKRLAALTGADAAELLALAGAIGLALPNDLLDEFGLIRLRDAAAPLRRLKTDVAQASAWVVAAPGAAAGVAARRAVQAYYDAGQWPDAIRPLEEKLREKRRNALVGYSVARPDAGHGETWTDSNGMYSHLLIDVETHPVVLTSRLKQAIGSVQLFVQRCLMNLEPDVAADESKDAGWTQWAWMKQYRVWEANRKIFLYPENWIVPELRDDKSPFFLELENSLLQADVTSDSAEEAYAAYLSRLDEVARLEVAGVFFQPGEGGAPDEYHVFARTHADPPAHYYRKWVGQSRWTPWERLDLDIPAGQLLPLVWNRRLYLFWPLFNLKTTEPAIGDKPVASTAYFEIQLAWSERRQDQWGPKQTTPAEVTLRSRIPPDDSLPDQARGRHTFRATTDGADLLVWYESTENVAPQLDKYGNLVRPGSVVATQGWRFSGCNGRVTIFNPFNVGVFPPPNTFASGMGYEEQGRIKGSAGGLNFAIELTDGTLQLPKGLAGADTDVVLRTTPGAEPYRLLPPHQEQYLSGRLPFFFQDNAETLFVIPREETEWLRVWTNPAWAHPALADMIDRIYYQPEPIPDPIGPVTTRWNPVPVIRQIYAASNNGSLLPVAGGLATPVTPALAMGKIALAYQDRKMQVLSLQGAKNREVFAAGDKKSLLLTEYLRPDRIFKPGVLTTSVKVRRYEFHNHYHPYVCAMMRQLNLSGVTGLLERATQLMSAASFEARYQPTKMVEMGDPAKKDKYPVEDVDFSFDGAYAGYNWELFFHVPLMIACKLSQNQRFEEAQQWFHAIFDPTDVSSAPVPARYWRTRPFYEQQDYLKQRIDQLLQALAKGEPDDDLSRQLSEWVANPFRPFAVARVRTVAFQKCVVMKYLDNLIAWGDQLFLNDTLESINEATQLYILAAEILGPRPAVIAPRATPETHTFNTLKPRFAALTNALTDIEVVVSSPRIDAVVSSPGSPPLPAPQLLYFCVPPNDKLLGYWDTVGDRLFKIRNSLNLAGIRRTLPLFEPPIDPMLLVKAAAAGVDLSTAIADAAAPAPLYRFQTNVAKAAELCQDVKALGAALLSALERRDAEQLLRIQAVNEDALLKRITAIKEEQIKDANAQIAALEAARELSAERYRHYMTLLGGATEIPPEGKAPADAQPVPGATTLVKDGVRMIAQESNILSEIGNASDAEQAASNWDTAANVAHLIPNFAGLVAPWGAGIKTEYGGVHVGAALGAIANQCRSSALDHRQRGEKASRLAEFIMRAHNWKLEANLAAREIARTDQDLAAARVRLAMATTDRDNHLAQIEDQEKVEEFLRTKYTNRELYDFLVGQISAVYFQAYQLAYYTARRAERAYRRELAIPDTDFIRFGYWDTLRKGLLAGDRLLHDVRRMEMAYLDANTREYEITKHVSLANLHPEGLLAFQEQGSCFVDLPEAIFDLDFPGQYLRRIKAVSLTIPCVAGPFTSVPCRLTLLANRTRVDPRPGPQYAMTGPDDQRFEFNFGGIRSVATSTGRDDSGAFEFNLHEERYLPFEGSGAISSWRLELPSDFRPFDYHTISDVVLHIRYTARDGGDPLRDAATKKLADALKAMEEDRGRAGLFRGFSARHEFPDAWHAFAHMPDGQAGSQSMTLSLTADRFPAFAKGRTVKVSRLVLALVPADGVAYDDNDPIALTLTPPGAAGIAATLQTMPNRAGGLGSAVIDLAAPVAVPVARPGDPPPKPWAITLDHVSANLARTVNINGQDVTRLDPAKVTDVAMLYAYSI